MMLCREAVARDARAPRALVRRAPAADEHLALRVLAARHRLDLVLLEHRVPAEHRLDGPSTAANSAFTGPLPVPSIVALLPVRDERTVPLA